MSTLQVDPPTQGHPLSNSPAASTSGFLLLLFASEARVMPRVTLWLYAAVAALTCLQARASYKTPECERLMNAAIRYANKHQETAVATGDMPTEEEIAMYDKTVRMFQKPTEMCPKESDYWENYCVSNMRRAIHTSSSRSPPFFQEAGKVACRPPSLRRPPPSAPRLRPPSRALLPPDAVRDSIRRRALKR